jgi:methionyl-tRNA formyltransferase
MNANRRKRKKVKCVIASGKPWHTSMAASLAHRTGAEFISITRPEELTAGHLATIEPRYVFLPHWSHRIGAEIFEHFECIVFHMTDLPFGRGGSPLQNLIARGFRETRLSAIRCVKELDAGPVYMKRPLSLLGSAEEIFLRARSVIEDMILEILRKRPRPRAQRGTPTVFKRRTPADGNLAAARTLDQAFDLIRMLDAEGYPSAFLNAGPFRIEFTRASRKSGRILADARIAPTTPDASGDGHA